MDFGKLGFLMLFGTGKRRAEQSNKTNFGQSEIEAPGTKEENEGDL